MLEIESLVSVGGPVGLGFEEGAGFEVALKNSHRVRVCRGLLRWAAAKGSGRGGTGQWLRVSGNQYAPRPSLFTRLFKELRNWGKCPSVAEAESSRA